MAKGNRQEVDCKWCDASGWIDQEKQLDCEHCEGDGWVWEAPLGGGGERGKVKDESFSAASDPGDGIGWFEG